MVLVLILFVVDVILIHASMICVIELEIFIECYILSSLYVLGRVNMIGKKGLS